MEQRKSIKGTVKQLIPPAFRPAARRYYYKMARGLEFQAKRSIHFIPDRIDLLTGKRDSLTPPEWMIFVGSGDFKEIGEEFLGYFKTLACLKPGDKVLEVGCGIGRMAIPLTKYLRDGGSYEGFDIVASGIKWCRGKITPRFPAFHFRLADVYNWAYNPDGKIRAAEYRFPYGDDSFDFVFLTSVFTHMLRQDMENYFAETRRVLKAGGRCLLTFFLLNEESRALIDAKKSTLPFPYCMDGCRINDKEVPEGAVAYEECYIRDLFASNGLVIVEPIHYGSWCGREDFLSFQDIIAAVRND